MLSHAIIKRCYELPLLLLLPITNQVTRWNDEGGGRARAHGKKEIMDDE